MREFSKSFLSIGLLAKERTWILHRRKIRNNMFSDQQVEHYTAFITMKWTHPNKPRLSWMLRKMSCARPMPWEELPI